MPGSRDIMESVARCFGLRFAVIVVSVTLIFPVAGLAQDARRPLSREEAVRLFLEQNPEVEAARLEVERTRAGQIAAGLRPNPQLTLTAENFRLAGDTPLNRLYEVSASYSDTIELGDKRRLRGSVADLAVGVAEAGLAGTLRQRVYEVERLYLQAVLSRERRDLAVETRAAFANVLALNEARFEEGAVSEGDVIRVRLELVRVDAVVREAELALRQATIRLTEQLGGSDFDAWEIADDFVVFEGVPNLDALRETALAERPGLQAAQAEADRAEQRVALERALAVPDIHPFVGYKRVASSDTLLFGVSVPLNFRDGNQDGIARALTDRRIAESRLSAARNRVAAEVESAYRTWESARDRVSGFVDDLLSQADQAGEIALVSYEEGVRDLVSLLDTERVRADIRSEYLQALFDYGIGILELERAVGRDIEP